jgi:hypothetical protein
MQMTRKVLLLSFVALFLSATATMAGPIVRMDKGASNHGVADPFTSCVLATNANNCGNFATTSSRTVDGAPIIQFVTNTGDSGSLGTVILADVFQIPGTIAAGDVLTLNLVPSAGPIDFGIFACDNGSGGPIAGGGAPLTGPCTIGALSDLNSFVTETDSGNSASFTFLGLAGLPSTWAFYTDPGELASFTLNTGTTTSTPEPGSASLLLAGALAAGLVALKARR